MLCCHTGHIHIEWCLVLVLQVAILHHWLIEPFGEITIGANAYILILKAITYFYRSNFLVLSLVIDGIAGWYTHVDRLVHWCTADKSSIDKYIVVFSELIVDTSLDSTTDTRHWVASCNIIIVVAVGTPVVLTIYRSVYEGREVILAILQTCENTLLHDSTSVVTIGNTSDTNFLIYPTIVITERVVLCRHFESLWCIDEVVATHEIAQYGLVNTLIPTRIHTGGEVEAIEEFLIVCRNESYPVVIVTVLKLSEEWTSSRSSVECL